MLSKTLSSENKSSFKNKVTKIIPNIALLNLSEAEWILMQDRTKNAKHLSKNVLFIIADIRNQPLAEIITALVSRNFPRKARKEYLQAPVFQKRKYYRRKGGENPLIFEDTNQDANLSDYLSEKGIRTTLLTLASPEKNYQDLKQTPGKTKVRPFYSNNCGAFFKPLTPYGLKSQQGMAQITRPAPYLNLSCPKPIYFTATRDKISLRQGVKRPISQNQLAGLSCKTVFEEHGCDIEVKARGSDYHWSHLIAYFLGGEQNMNNLIPGTAASNYNTLELIENFIDSKLRDNDIPCINIVVKPIFKHDGFIPAMLKFHLDWVENGRPSFEIININPRSHLRISGSMHETVDLLRNRQKYRLFQFSDDRHHSHEDQLFNNTSKSW